MIIAFALLACADPEPVTTPFEGPGYDAETGLLVQQDRFVLAVTELHVKNDPFAGDQFSAHANAVGEALYAPDAAVPGFVGGSFRNVGQLQWWTLSVWTDEASMMEFVLAEPHGAAMADLSMVSSSARSTHAELDAADVPVEWDLALELIASEGWLVGDGA